MQMYWLKSLVTFVAGRVEGKKERGDITLQQVIWAAGIAIVAVAVVATIVQIINGYVAKIPQ